MLSAGCQPMRGCQTPVAAPALDAAPSPFVTATAVPYHAPTGAPTGESGAPIAPVLTAERALDSPPAAPAGCTLELPVRSVTVGDGPISFATAVAGARTLLALSTATESVAWITGSDQSVSTFAAIAAPAVALFAGGAANTLVLGWSDAVSAQDPRRTLRFALWGESLTPSVFALPAQFDRSVVDLACTRSTEAHSDPHCVLATNWREEFTPRDDLRAQWLLIEQQNPTRLRSLALLHNTHAQSVLYSPTTVGTISDNSTTSIISNTSSILSPERNVLDVQSHERQLLRLSATAPSAERCQPGQWTVQVSTSGPDGNPHTLQTATTDARPRGGRVRPMVTTSIGTPVSTDASATTQDPTIAFWLDAPQCAEQLFVIRALRHGQSVTLASATEFDMAADRALLSVAWKIGGQLRWARYRCE